MLIIIRAFRILGSQLATGYVTPHRLSEHPVNIRKALPAGHTAGAVTW